MENQQSENLPEVPKEDSVEWFERPSKRFSTKTPPIEQEVLRAYYECRPTVTTDAVALQVVMNKVGVTERAAERIIAKHFAKEEGKKQRREYADEIYKEKIPIAKAVVAMSLDKLCAFVNNCTVETFEDAKALSKIASDMNVLLRLELGQSTNNVEVITRTEKSVQTLLGELKEVDPFVNYTEITDVPTQKSDSK